jgi:hypothetical protein
VAVKSASQESFHSLAAIPHGTDMSFPIGIVDREIEASSNVFLKKLRSSAWESG